MLLAICVSEGLHSLIMALAILAEAGVCFASLLHGFRSSRISAQVKGLSMVLFASGAAFLYRYMLPSASRMHVGVTLSAYVFTYIAGQAFVCIGLTGGIACGKSSVVEVIRKSFPEVLILDCDKIVRDLQRAGMPVFNQIIAAFGQEMIGSDGELNRPKLAKLIFSDATARKRINAITHPAVSRAILWSVLQGRLHGYRNILLDAPLLFETKVFPYFCYPIVTVTVGDREVCLQRLMARDNIGREDAENKVKAQMPVELKAKLSHYVINNAGGFEELEESTMRVFREVLGKA